MYLGKQKREINTGMKRLVNFCKDCGSQNIEVVYTCKDCGSHNIGKPLENVLDGLNDNRSIKYDTKFVNVYFYKCDNCGKSFQFISGEDNPRPNSIYFEDGLFYEGSTNNDDALDITLSGDICHDCITEIVDKLNSEIDNIVSKKHIDGVINDLKKLDNSEKTELEVVSVREETLDSVIFSKQYVFKGVNGDIYKFMYNYTQWQFVTLSDSDSTTVVSGRFDKDKYSKIETGYDEVIKFLREDVGICIVMIGNKDNVDKIYAYDFDTITLAAPTQYIFRDNDNIQYYFRYRWGKYKLYKYYSTSDEKIICEGEYGNSLDGYVSVQEFINLMKKNHNVDIIVVNYKEE